MHGCVKVWDHEPFQFETNLHRRFNLACAFVIAVCGEPLIARLERLGFPLNCGGFSKSIKREIFRSVEHNNDFLYSGTALSDLEMTNVLMEVLDGFKQRFFHTRTGYLGLVPPRLQPGDRVCVLRRCRPPVLLRKSDSSARWKLVGTCYVVGLFGDEDLSGHGPIENLRAKELEEEVFEIE